MKINRQIYNKKQIKSRRGIFIVIKKKKNQQIYIQKNIKIFYLKLPWSKHKKYIDPKLIMTYFSLLMTTLYQINNK